MNRPQPQPAKAALALRRISNRKVAAILGCSEHWVGRVLNGYAPAPESFERALSELLDEPASSLFREADELGGAA